jgi:hypothetical protein
MYQGETLATISTEATAGLFRAALNPCLLNNKAIAKRFTDLKSEKPLHMTEESAWLTHGLTHWFAKKWNDMRRLHELKKEQPAKKTKVHVCDTCHTKLQCPSCEGTTDQVFALLISLSDVDRMEQTIRLKPTSPTTLKLASKLSPPSSIVQLSTFSSRPLTPSPPPPSPHLLSPLPQSPLLPSSQPHSPPN